MIRNILPDEAKRCIDSWKKYCPDYQIIEWNESNFDVNCCAYVKEAYEAGKWAFVSDYARFDILYRYGGIYFDTDVEMINSIDDILEKGSFMGREDINEEIAKQDKVIAVNPGIGLAADPGLELYKEILDCYNQKHFYNSDGSFNQTTVVEFTTNILKKYGLKAKNEIQCINGIYIYPSDYFCPMNYYTGQIKITENSRSIHHYTSSWFTDEEKKYRQFELNMQKKFGKRIAGRLERIYSFPYRVKKKIALKGLKGTIKFSIRKFLHEY